MTIQFNTDNNINGRETFEAKCSTIITEGLSRFTAQITRVEVHLSDEDSGKNGVNDKRCKLETRLAGLQPMLVSHDADDFEAAVKGAVQKMKTSIDSKIGQLKSH